MTKQTSAGATDQAPTVTITLIRSPITCLPKHRATVKGLGLTGRLNQTVTLKNTPAIWGMINQVSYLLKVEGK
jgi:large subunit ribosomal protein L30